MVIVMFDLPTSSKDERKRYTDFRKGLLESGFIQLQYSVYARYSSSPEKAEAIHNSIVKNLPQKGESTLAFNDGQPILPNASFPGKNATRDGKKSQNNLLFSRKLSFKLLIASGLRRF